jgi:hypothetical protein
LVFVPAFFAMMDDFSRLIWHLAKRFANPQHSKHQDSPAESQSV